MRFKRKQVSGPLAPPEPSLTQLVLIDVDGTISPCQYDIDNDLDYYESVNGWNGNHYFPNALREDLMRLPAPKFWLTSWQEDAEATFRTGWRPLLNPQESYLWKMDAAEELFRKNPLLTTVVWFDDESIDWDFDTLFRQFPNIDFYIPEIDPDLGLSSTMVANAAEFLEDRQYPEY